MVKLLLNQLETTRSKKIDYLHYMTIIFIAVTVLTLQYNYKLVVKLLEESECVNWCKNQLVLCVNQNRFTSMWAMNEFWRNESEGKNIINRSIINFTVCNCDVAGSENNQTDPTS